MNYSITNIKIPDIIFDYENHIIKCVETNTPIKRAIRKEIYKWIIEEIIDHKNISKNAFVCVIIKAMYYSISDDIYNPFIGNFNLNNVTQNVFPELNIVKIKRYAEKK